MTTPRDRFRNYIEEQFSARGDAKGLAELDQMWARHDDMTATYQTWNIPVTDQVQAIEPPDEKRS